MSIRRFWRLQKNDRVMFYALLAAQVEAGFVAPRACRELAEMDGLPGGILELARAGGQAEWEGRPVVEGLAATGLLPDEDVAILTVAGQYGSLPEALRRLADREEDIPGIIGRVVAPNAYFLMVLGVLLSMVMSVTGFFERMRLDGGDNPLYRASVALQDWMPAALWAVGCLAAAIFWAVRRSTLEPLRRLAEPFDGIERLRIGIRYCNLAAMMSRHGAVGHVILEHVALVFRTNPYLRRHAREAHDSIITRGTRLEDALAGGVLGGRYAALLKGLVPGGALDRYEAGYRTLAAVQRQMLVRRLDVLHRAFRGLLLFGMLACFLLIFDGVYSMYDSVTTYQ